MLSDLLDRERATGSVERRDSLAQAEVTRRPRVRPGEMAREEPVRGPAAEPSNGRDGSDHLIVVESGECVEVEVGVRELEHVLGLRAREAEHGEVPRAQAP